MTLMQTRTQMPGIHGRTQIAQKTRIHSRIIVVAHLWLLVIGVSWVGLESLSAVVVASARSVLRS